MADEQEKDSGSSAEWMQKLWRPAMGWMYMLICMADMIVFPVLWALWQGINHVPITQWNPLTLQGAGLFHIAMGAVLGISAFGRTQEKLAGTAANPTSTSSTSTQNVNMTGNVAGGYGSMPLGNSMSTGGFGGMNNGGYGSQPGGAPAFGAPQAGGFGSSTGGFGSTPTPAAGGFGGGGFGSTPTATASSGSAGGFGSGFNSGSGATPATAPALTSSGKKVVPSFDQPAL